MNTTIEVTKDVHDNIVIARKIIYDKYKIQLRISDMMSHIAKDPNTVANTVLQSVMNSTNEFMKPVSKDDVVTKH